MVLINERYLCVGVGFWNDAWICNKVCFGINWLCQLEIAWAYSDILATNNEPFFTAWRIAIIALNRSQKSFAPYGPKLGA